MIPAELAAINRSVVDLIQYPIIWLILITIMMSFLKMEMLSLGA
jgi:hypothetical protein